ncbi:outer membrane beta-barrel family protein [Bernardetia sp. ABR2-2B]|uniref:outer membrane beta-barrel family protein n=1 Tax=Bernardetia sp. ABR2-2B TaxID=3127472 RepID=UPI0030D0997A
MKSLFYIFALYFLVLSGFAQSYSIKGIVESETNEPISFAAVGLMNQSDSSLAKATIADDEGKFRLVGISEGNYFITISSVGYDKFNQKIKVLNESLDLGKLILKSNNVLEAVEVKVQKPLVEVFADKTVFNVEGTIAATGSSALEVLRKAPSVILDNNDNLMVEGKTGVQVYIDGKQSVLQGEALTNYLNTLQASDIESIEIITQPSSKYDAAGSAGILNIKLKKNKNFGTNGSVGVGYSVWENHRMNSSLSLNNRTKKTNTFLTYSNRLGKTGSFINLYRKQNDLIFDAQSETLRDRNSHNFRAGTDIFASEKSTFGVLVTANLSDNYSETDTDTPISRQDTGETLQVLKADNTNDSEFYNLLGNLNYRYEDTLGHSFNVDLDYGKYDAKSDSYQPNLYYNANETEVLSSVIFEMIAPTTIDILTGKIDYEQNFLKGKLALGVKASQVKTDNTFKFYDVLDGNSVLNTDQSNQFFYTENINAAYFNYNRKWKKMNLQFGLRVENTVSDGKLNSTQEENNERVKRNYTNFFPSGGLTYKPNRQNSFALTYSKRIERPNYQNLNPFERQLSELSIAKGNAFLQPQYIDNIKLSHTYKYTLNTSVSYSYVQDFFAQVTQARDERRSVLQTQNVASQEVWSFSLSYPFNVTKWWSVYTSLNAYHSAYKGTTDAFLSISQNTVSGYGQNTFSLPKDFKFEVSGWFSSPSVWGGTYQTKSLGSLNLALQKKFLDDKFSLRLSLNDALFTSPWRGMTEFDNVVIDGNGGWESRQFRINLSYNFGSKQVKSARKRKTAADEESGRI